MVVHLAVSPYAWTTSPSSTAPATDTEPPSNLTAIRDDIEALREQARELIEIEERFHARQRRMLATDSSQLDLAIEHELMEREAQLAEEKRALFGSLATPSQFERPMGRRPPVVIPTSDSVTLPYFNTFPFIRRLHYKALRALSVSTPAPPEEPDLPLLSKEMAKTGLEAMGFRWHPIFDAEFPGPSEGGAMYEYTMIA